jgi:hypothetical protein
MLNCFPSSTYSSWFHRISSPRCRTVGSEERSVVVVESVAVVFEANGVVESSCEGDGSVAVILAEGRLVDANVECVFGWGGGGGRPAS